MFDALNPRNWDSRYGTRVSVIRILSQFGIYFLTSRVIVKKKDCPAPGSLSDTLSFYTESKRPKHPYAGDSAQERRCMAYRLDKLPLAYQIQQI